MKKKDQLITKQHKIIAYFLILPGHYTRKIAFLCSDTLHFQIEVLFGIKKKKTKEFHTEPNNTKLEGPY
jgi:hypothetical protein